MSEDSPFSIEEYCLSLDSSFSTEEYCLSTDSPYSIEEYCLSSSSPTTNVNNDTCEEFSIEEYDINKDTKNEVSANETSNIMGDGHNKELDSNKVTPTSMQEEKPRSPMHIRRIP